MAYNHYPESDTEFARAFRLPEAYLNLAEAKAMLFKLGKEGGTCTEALDALNELRMNRFTATSYRALDINDPEILIREVRAERRRELCFEDHRWFDLRRYGMPKIVHKWSQSENVTVEYVLEEKDPGYVLPIPPEALEKNTALVQNPLAPLR